jgi:FAD/FMN-containing dehydrogenase
MSKSTLLSTAGKPIEEAALGKLEAGLLGQVIRLNSERYELERRLWNGTTDPRRPGVIVRCRATADVVRCIDFARSTDLAIAVRGAGHSLAGDSFCDGGMLIDVSGMKGVQVDPEMHKAQCAAGLTSGEFDRATQAFGLATVLGYCSSVGVAGYTLGGGLGPLMGQYGAGSDNLLSAEIVDAEGRVLRASPHEREDLFWAIRGGGGNFGIATSLEYRLHPVGQILGGALRYPISATREVLSFLAEYMMTVADELDVAVDIGNVGMMLAAPVVKGAYRDCHGELLRRPRKR